MSTSSAYYYCAHSEASCTASCPITNNETTNCNVQILCINCYKDYEDNAKFLSLQPLREEYHCMDCNHSPARYSSNLRFSMCDNCRAQQTQSFLSLSFLKPKTKSKELPDDIFENRVFLGSQVAASNREGLVSLQITSILVCGTGLQMSFQNDPCLSIRYHLLPLEDSLDQNLIAYLPTAMKFIDETLAQGGKVLLHCQAGISRSAAVCIAFLMYNQGWDYNTSQSYVRNKRRIIHPNHHFVETLKTDWLQYCQK